jgi:hypothetical protein
LEDWAAAGEERPILRSYRIVSADDGRVAADVEVVPTVNEITGVRPGSATMEFRAVEADGGWRLRLAETTFSPHFADDDGAPPVALSWIAAAQRCDDDARTALQYDGNLLGELQLATALCERAGTAKASDAKRLDALVDPTVILNSFGEDAALWSRVVTVDGLGGAPSVNVLLAPFGDRWVVIGGLSSR